MAIRPAVMLTIAAVTVVALTLWQVSNVVRIKTLLIAIEQKQHSLDSLHALVRHEQIAIARLESAERIRRLAHEWIGLIQPVEPPRYLLRAR